MVLVLAEQPAGVAIGAGGQAAADAAQPTKPASDQDMGKPGAAKSVAAEQASAESPEPKVIRRDESKYDEANQDELNAAVGDDGRVAFQFRNQPWVELVGWLADISNQPIDWLELPADRVNIRSPGRYTVAETIDLFNRHLLARGYTLLEIDGGLTITKTAGINPAIVPRVERSVLSELPPYSFVRTSLDAGWLSAEKLAEELMPMVSSNGKLTALKTTNRIEAMDAAVNLAQVAMLIEQEHGSASRAALAPEVRLRYLPAEEAKGLLEQFLGVEKKQAEPMTPQQLQMLQQQRQQQGQAAPPPEPKSEISIVANLRQNSVIIRAPADRVAIAMEFLKRIDVPSDTMASLSDIETRVKVFRLASLDPEKLIEMINEMNVLEPVTRIRADKANQALIVYGSVADRYIIDSLIKRLDGSGRSFEVLPLRRLDPVEVAESIAFLMGQEKEEEDTSSRRRYYWYGNDNSKQDDKQQDEFRVAANARNRQVLLWANEQEMSEVRSLLVKLGELPPPGGNRDSIRIIDASATPETYEYLQQLQQRWNQLAPNPLQIPDANQFKDPNRIPGRQDQPLQDDDQPVQPDSESQVSEDDSIAAHGNRRRAVSTPASAAAVDLSPVARHEPQGRQLTNMQVGLPADPQRETDSPAIRSSQDFDRRFGSQNRVPDDQGQPAGPPVGIRVELDRDGNLILVSPDTAALDRLENLMLQFAPPKRPYQVFHIQHVSAFWVRMNLEEYFKDTEDKDSEADVFYRWWMDIEKTEDKGPSGLGKGVKLRFVDDIDTGTLVVSGATSSQLKTISELIELWDIPEPVNKRKTRFTDIVSVQFGRAEKIAETVKEAYRDLLSSNDKTFSGSQQPGQAAGANQNQAQKSRSGNGSSFQDSDSERNGGGADFSFKGKLSIGVDTVGNTLLVSAEGEPLMNLVSNMIRKLDEAARPSGEVQVIELPGTMSGKTLQLALQALGAAEPGGEKSQSPRDVSDAGTSRRDNRDRRRDGVVGSGESQNAQSESQP
jgi:type II secretory pathway component GspD/PulD (secretin)